MVRPAQLRKPATIEEFIATAKVGQDLKHKAFSLSNQASTGKWHYTDHGTAPEAKTAIEKGLPGYIANELRLCPGKWQIEWYREPAKETE